MGQPRTAARATARVDQAVPGAHGPQAGLTLRRDPAAFARILLRVMLIQAALLAAAGLAVILAGPPRAVAASVAVGLILVTTLVLLRRRGRWWTEHLGIVVRYRRRRRPRELGPGGPLRALPLLVPELQVTDVAQAGGEPIGVGRDATGWYAVAAVPPRLGLEPPVPLSALAANIAETGQPGVSLQLVLHTDAAPAADLEPGQPGADSYRQLLDACGAVPAARARWIAVRVDEAILAVAAADGDPDRTPQAAELTAALIRRVARVLDRSGLPGQVLDAAGLVDALCRCLDLGPPVPTASSALTGREAWRTWHSMRLAHTAFWVRGWPAAGAPLAGLGDVRGAQTTVAVTVRPQPGPRPDAYDICGLARVATRPEDLRRACAELVSAAHRSGARLFRLDGEHAPAAYATAPTGGGS